MARYPGDDGAGSAGSVVDAEFKQFVRFLDALASKHGAYPEVYLAELLYCYFRLHLAGLEIADSVFFLYVFEAVGLGLYGFVAYFFKQQFGLAYLGAFLQRTCANLVPFQFGESEDSGEFWNS